MGYERNDRRYGGYSPDRNDRDYGSYGGRGRATSYGYGSRDYRGDRFDDRPDDRRFGGREDPNDRGFFDRAGDEVRSWFGDEEAERRRREDAVYDERHRSYGSGDYNYGRNGRSDYYAGGLGFGDFLGFGAYDDRSADRGQRDRSRHAGDPNYHSWRNRQIDALDRDYDEYRREHQSRFDSEFHGWRQNRQGQRDQLGKVQEHQEVVGSDGAHVGTVDHVRGDHIRLTKQDSAAHGHHHGIPSSWIQSVDDKVTLNRTADQAKQHWRDEERNSQGGLFGRDRDDDRGGVNLNRSFSGTY